MSILNFLSEITISNIFFYSFIIYNDIIMSDKSNVNKLKIYSFLIENILKKYILFIIILY